MDLIALEKERLKWALETFPKATAISSLRKLESEIREIEADVLNGVREPEEYVDAMMCIFDSAARMGISIEELVIAFAAKLKKNKRRKWKINPDNSYSHIKQ